MSALRIFAVACVAAWLGVTAFFSFAAAPLLFRLLERASAGQVVAALLPRYYGWGLVLGVLTLLSSLVLALGTGTRRRHDLVAAALAAIMVAGLAWSLVVTLPAAEAAHRAGDSAAFAATHRSAMWLNLLTMLCGAGFVGLQLFTGTARRDE